MKGFYKKMVQSFLSLSQSFKEPQPPPSPASTTSNNTSNKSPSHIHHHQCLHIPSHSGCLCFLTGDTQKPSSTVMHSNPIKPTSSSTFGFLLDDGDGLLTSCTESLGFESSAHPMEEDSLEEELSRSSRSKKKTVVVKVRRRQDTTKFPPPLSSLNQHGQRNFYLKPVRNNGRLEITEVRIQRPKVFRASRQDGRLRLQLIRSESQHSLTPDEDEELEEQESLSPLSPHHHEEEEEEEITEKQKENVEEEQERDEEEISGKEEEEALLKGTSLSLTHSSYWDFVPPSQKKEEGGGEEEEEEESEEERRMRQWNLDGIRRCHELNSHRPDHHKPNHLLFAATIV